MKLGIVVPHFGELASARSIDAICEAVEESGLDSLWVQDHIAIPQRVDSTYPYDSGKGFPAAGEVPVEWWECLSVLAYVAARTRTVQIGSSVLVLPYRHPLLVAKMAATIDQLSNGRVILGVGAGWLGEEFDALRVGDLFGDRGTATDEAIQIMRDAWSDQWVERAEGPFSFPQVNISPRPHAPTGIPVWVGGNSRPALRRAARYGDGWHGLRLSVDQVAAALDFLRLETRRHGRSERTLEISLRTGLLLVTSRSRLRPERDPAQPLVGTPEMVAKEAMRLGETGVQHLVLSPLTRLTLDAYLESIFLLATEVRPALEATRSEA